MYNWNTSAPTGPAFLKSKGAPASLKRALLTGAFGAAFLLAPHLAQADTTPQTLPFTQDWSDDNGLGEVITTNNDFSTVPGIVGFNNVQTASGAGIDPQTIVDGNGGTSTSGTTGTFTLGQTQITANAPAPAGTNPSGGGLFEFETVNSDPVVAFQGSGTADAPNLVITLNTTGKQGIRVRYNLRDVDPQATTTVQQVALQFRVGTTDNFTNVPAGYVANAAGTAGLATKVTAVDAILPTDADNKGTVQVRVITADAPGSDELIGVDDINITGADIVAGAPGVANFTQAMYMVNEGAGTATITLTRSGGSTGSLSVNYTTNSGGTAIAGSDFTSTSGTATFADGVTTTSFTVPITDDSTVEGNETFTLTLSGAGAGTTQATATVTIVDDERGTGLINEIKNNPPGNDAPQEFVELKGTPGAALPNVYLVFVPGDAAFPNSLGTANRVFNLSAFRYGSNGLLLLNGTGGPAPQDAATNVATFAALGGTGATGAFFNGTGSFLLYASNTGFTQGADLDTANNGTLDGVPADATLLDSVGFSDGNDGDITYGGTTLRLGSGSTGDNTTAGNNTPEAENAAPDAATRLLNNTAANSASAFYFGELVTDATTPDPTTLQYDAAMGSANLPSGAVLTPGAANFAGAAPVPTPTFTPTPTPIPAQGVVQFSADNFTVNEGAGTATITVTRTGDTSGAASVTATTSNGTATSADFTAATNTVNFAAGATSATFTVPIIDDSIGNEGSETITLTLSAPTGATLGTTSTATLTITDNDTVTLSISDVTQNEGSGGGTPTRFDFTVTLSNQSATNVSFDYATANGTATAGSDYTAVTTTTVTFTPAQALTKTISIAVTPDDTVEADETFFVNLSNPSGATLADAQGLGTIQNDDVAPSSGTIQFSSATYSVSEAGPSVTITVTRTGGSAGAVSASLLIGATGDTATAGSDFTAPATNPTTITFAAGSATSQTLVIPISEDTLVEGDETFTAALTNPTGGATLGMPTTARVTITDNDTAPPAPGLIVTNTNDSGAGSLRAAMQFANANGGGTITFNIAGTGPFTITPATALPALTQATLINGFSQTGSSPNTAVNTDTSTRLITLSGATVAASSSPANGLTLSAAGSRISGLTITGFKGMTSFNGILVPASGIFSTGANTRVDGCDVSGNGNGVAVLNAQGPIIGGSTPAARNILSGNGNTPPAGGMNISFGAALIACTGGSVQGNFIGTDGVGNLPNPNTGGGVLIGGGSGNVIGGGTGARNIITGNNGGVTIAGFDLARLGAPAGFFPPVPATNNVVQGNFIGLTANGLGRGNAFGGVFIFNFGAPAINNTVGLNADGSGIANIIAFNNGDGVQIADDSTGNRIKGNQIGNNGSGAGDLGIDLLRVGSPVGGDGITPNDRRDGDTGPNRLQNFPVLTSANRGATTNTPTIVTGTLNSTPNTTFDVEFFGNPSTGPVIDDSEGSFPLGTIQVTTGDDGNASFSSSVQASTSSFITATATDPQGNTSEFSAISRVNDNPPQNISVTPANASVAPDTEQVLSATYADPDGVDDLSFVYLRVNQSGKLSNRDAIVLRYDVQNNLLSILNDSGTRFLGNVAPGTTGRFNTVSNSQAIFAPARTTVTRNPTNGNFLTVNFSFKVKGALAGTVNDVSLSVSDTSGQSDNVGGFNSVNGFDPFGTLTITGNQAPTNVSLNPTSATDPAGQERLFTATYSDPNGFKNLDVVRLRIEGVNSQSFADDLIVSYDIQRGELFLISEDGTSFNARGQRPQVTSGRPITNSRGSLNPVNSRVTRSGNTLTVTFAITASSNFGGDHFVDLLAQDQGGLGTGYVFFGNYRVGIVAPVPGVAARSAALSSSAASVSNDSVTLKFSRPVGESAADPTQYAVTVNGASVEVQSAVVKGGTTVTLLLPAGSLQAGDAVTVATKSGTITTTAK